MIRNTTKNSLVNFLEIPGSKKIRILVVLFLFSSFSRYNCAFCEVRTIHVFVALCDNEHQGIVPVPEIFGNGDDP